MVGSERRIFSATECVLTVQGHPISLILAPIERAYATSYGGAEFAGQENGGQRNFRGWKMQDWKMTDKSAAGKKYGTRSAANGSDYVSLHDLGVSVNSA